MGLKTDRESLIKRYLGKQWLKRPGAFSAIELALRFFGSFNWKRNVTDNTKPPLPIVPMDLGGVKELADLSKSNRQELIKQEHARLAWEYHMWYTQAYLLGKYVIRVHVKKVEQLLHIFDLVKDLPMLLKAILEKPKKRYDFILMSLPKSTQATRLRGFFMYLQYEDEELACAAQAIFENPSKYSTKEQFSEV